MCGKRAPRSLFSKTAGFAGLIFLWSVATGETCFDPLGPGEGLGEDPNREISEVRISPTELTVELGRSAVVYANAYDQYGDQFASLPPGYVWQWSSSNSEVASVSSSGLVTGVGKGQALIAVTVAGLADTATVDVQRAAPTGGEPELPRVFLDTRYRPPTGNIIQVNAGDNLQSALNNAQPGDQILLQAGATFEGSFTLPAKSGSDWIVIRTSASDAQLPPEGTRIDPSDAGVLPKIVANGSGPALKTAAGAHHYRIIGVEFAVRSNVTLNYGIVTLGDGSGAQNTLEEVPHDLILDRVYVHGHSNLNVSRCVALNSAATAVIDSYLSECHARGFDSQAIGGWNGPGPFKIVNNYLEGSGENVMFGGADPAIQGLVPSDIEMRRNHFNKPLSWRGDWTAKNLLELKLGRRVWIDGNVFEHSWADAQVGFAILAWSVNQSGGAPWSVTEDITFTNNLVRHAAGGFNLAAKGGSPSQTTARVKIANNVFEDIDASTWGGGENGRLFQLLGALRDVKINHNTGFASASIIVAEGSPQTHFTFRDNIVDRARYGIIGTGTGEGLPTLTAYMPDHDLLGNLIIGGEASLYPPGNAFPANTIAVRFVNFPDGNYRLMTDSPYKGAATDGEDPGADMDAVETATAGVAQ